MATSPTPVLRSWRRAAKAVAAELRRWQDTHQALETTLSSLSNVGGRAQYMMHMGIGCGGAGGDDVFPGGVDFHLRALSDVPWAAEKLLSAHLTELERLLGYVRRCLGALMTSVTAVEAVLDSMMQLARDRPEVIMLAQRGALGDDEGSGSLDARDLLRAKRNAEAVGSPAMILHGTWQLYSSMAAEHQRCRSACMRIFEAGHTALQVNVEAVAQAERLVRNASGDGFWDEELVYLLLRLGGNEAEEPR